MAENLLKHEVSSDNSSLKVSTRSINIKTTLTGQTTYDDAALTDALRTPSVSLAARVNKLEKLVIKLISLLCDNYPGLSRFFNPHHGSRIQSM